VSVSARLFSFLLIVALLASPLSLRGDEQPRSLDDILEGFEEEDETFVPEEGETSPVEVPGARRFWDLTGSLGLSSSYNFLHHRSPQGTNYFGMQKLRTRLDLQLDLFLPGDWKGRVAGFTFYDFAYLAHGRGEYTDDVLRDYEWDADFQDVYVQGSPLQSLDVKIGRQVVNWGRSDTLRVLDILNPLDNREPGLVDIKDLRRSVGMGRLDYFIGSWSLTAIAIPEIRFDYNPPFGSDFNPFTTELEVPIEDDPSLSLDNTEWAGAVTGIFHGWDVSFHAAYYWEDWPYIYEATPTPQNPLAVTSRHGRQTLLGSGGNYTIGPWLLKAELAYLDGVDYTVGEVVDLPGLGSVSIPVGTVEKSRIDVMGGVEYYGISETTVALEVVERHVHGYERRMSPFDVQHDRLETALRISADFFHARLHTTALGVVYGEQAQDGAIVRLSGEYELRDALTVGGGVVLYVEGDPFYMLHIGDNDRFFLDVKYSF